MAASAYQDTDTVLHWSALALCYTVHQHCATLELVHCHGQKDTDTVLHYATLQCTVTAKECFHCNFKHTFYPFTFCKYLNMEFFIIRYGQVHSILAEPP